MNISKVEDKAEDKEQTYGERYCLLNRWGKEHIRKCFTFSFDLPKFFALPTDCIRS